MQLKKITFWFSALALSAVTAMGVILLLIWQAYHTLEYSQNERLQATALNTRLQQETEQLTSLVRAYTTTGESHYLLLYFEIIAIQNGEKSVPANFSALTYWDQAIAGQAISKPRSDLKGQSLKSMMRTQHFSDAEIVALEQVMHTRDELKKLEQIAFAATQGLYDPRSGNFISDGKPNREFASQLVNGQAYNVRKAEQSQTVLELANLTERRTTRQVELATRQLERLILASLVCMAVIILLILLSARTINLQVLRPLRHLKTAADRLAAGEYVARVRGASSQAPVAGDLPQERRARRKLGVAEIDALGNTMNQMAHAIDEDLRARSIALKELDIARKIAEEATQSKSIFLANMSHEIRTPMNAVIGMTYLALETDLTRRQHDYISKAHQAAHTLLGTINSILDFSKIEAGKISLENHPFNLEQVLANTLTLVRQSAGEKDLHLLLDCVDPRLLGTQNSLSGDALRFGEVLTNLLSNAVKFTETGVVRLTVKLEEWTPDDVALHVCVSDSGIGISSSEQAKLFTEFSQADNSTTRRYGGTGLGLFIAKKMVQLMQGRIWVESQTGLGARFHFTARFSHASVLPQAATAPPWPACRVLLLDEHPDALASARAMLLALGVAEIDACLSADTALRYLRDPDRGPYNLVLFDWRMRAITGTDFLAQLSALALMQALTPAPTPVVLVRADSNHLREAAEQGGVTEFLDQPLLPNELRTLLLRAAKQASPLSAEQEDPSQHHALARPQDLLGMRVLLVEDHPINRQLAHELMRAWGVECGLAQDGRAALDLLAYAPAGYFHLVLTDLQMPIMDGFALTTALRADSRHAGLPIIALSADVLPEERERCVALGFNAHLDKPIEPDQLHALLRQYFLQDADVSSASDLRLAQLAAANHESAGEVEQVLNRSVGLRRAGGSEQTYSAMLTLFRAEYTDAATRWANLIDEASWDTAQRMAHTFKGLAGTIGAEVLAKLTTPLELACQQKQADPAYRAIAALQIALDSLLEQLATLPAEADRPLSKTSLDHAMEAPPIDAREWQHLRALLAAADSDAILAWDSMRVVLQTQLTPEILHGVTRALQQIDFDQALALLPETCPTSLA